jgi:hypothetical protein
MELHLQAIRCLPSHYTVLRQIHNCVIKLRGFVPSIYSKNLIARSSTEESIKYSKWYHEMTGTSTTKTYILRPQDNGKSKNSVSKIPKIPKVLQGLKDMGKEKHGE